jgi:hypothetical protein
MNKFTVEEIRKAFRFCHNTFGVINIKLNRFVGWKQNGGYICVDYKGCKILAHRIIWVLHYGYWPIDQIDHINGIRNNNSILNLREANHSTNGMNRGCQKNNTTGYKGVYKMRDRFQARITINGKYVYIGTYKTKEQASKAYKLYAKSIFGEFAHEAI